nr:hypothetical protein [Lachnospiraceae bacterium]
MKNSLLCITLCVVLLLSGCGENAASGTVATEQAQADAGSSEIGEASDKYADEAASEASETSSESAEDSPTFKTEPLPDNVDDILAGMTLEEKVGQIMVPAFRIWKEVPSGIESEVKNTVENAEDDIPGTNIT